MNDPGVFLFLFNALWQAALFALTAWAVVRFMKIRNASARTLVWSAAFFLSVIAPLTAIGPADQSAPSRNAPSTITSGEAGDVAGNGGAPFAEPDDSGPVQAPGLNPAMQNIAGKAAFVLICAWALITALRVAVLVRDSLSIAQLRWDSAPLHQRPAALNLPEHVSLRTHPDIRTPLASGLFRSAVIIPETMAGHLDEPATRSIIAHELAHIRRGDLLAAVAEAAVLAFFWWNPLLWRMKTMIARNREMACDDSAAKAIDDPGQYATSLIDYAENALKQRTYAENHAMLAASGRPSDLKQRITRLLSEDYDAELRKSAARIVAGLSSLLLVSTGAALAAPKVAISWNNSAFQQMRYEQPSATSDAERFGRLLVNAIADGDWDGADALIAAGADVNAVLYGDGTPLIAAVKTGSTEYAAKLIELGADVDAVVRYDETALISAVREGDAAMVRLLINAGADVNLAAVTETGVQRSPLGEAQRLNMREIEQILRNAGAS